MDDINRPPLSPAAQAVLDAVPPFPIHEQAIAAALRAAGDAVVNPDDYEPACVFDKDYWDAGFSAAVETIREQLLRIAAELEGADQSTSSTH